MPITIQYAPAPALLGQAANLAGLGQYYQDRDRFLEEQRRFQEELSLRYTDLGERQRQFDLGQEFGYAQLGERAREFDVGQALQERQFTEGQRQFDLGHDLNQQRFGEDVRQFDTRLEETQRQFDMQNELDRIRTESEAAYRQGQLQLGGAELEERQRQFNIARQQEEYLTRMAQRHDMSRISLQGAINNALQKDRIEADIFGQQMSLAAATETREDTQAFQIQQQRTQAIRAQAAAEWQALIPVLRNLPPDEQADLVERFNAKWQFMQADIPIEFPDFPIPPAPEQLELEWQQEKDSRDYEARIAKEARDWEVEREKNRISAELVEIQRQKNELDYRADLAKQAAAGVKDEATGAQKAATEYQRVISKAYQDAQPGPNDVFSGINPNAFAESIIMSGNRQAQEQMEAKAKVVGAPPTASNAPGYYIFNDNFFSVGYDRDGQPVVRKWGESTVAKARRLQQQGQVQPPRQRQPGLNELVQGNRATMRSLDARSRAKEAARFSKPRDKWTQADWDAYYAMPLSERPPLPPYSWALKPWNPAPVEPSSY